MSICSGILNLLFPPRCVFCRAFIREDEQGICRKCIDELPYLTGSGRRTEGEFFERCVSSLRYEDNVRRSILRFKFGGKRNYAKVYGSILARCINEEYKGQYDLITWVPVHPRRKRKRGYDQTELLAHCAAGVLGVVCQPRLVKLRDNPAQSSIRGQAQRRANVLGVYRAQGELAGQRVLLIDDVVTTASTLGEASRTLLMAGADCVLCATLAKSRKGQDGKKK